MGRQSLPVPQGRSLAVGRIIVNFALFQAGWVICVMSAAAGRPYVAVLTAALIVGWHVLRAPRATPELTLVAAVVGIGVVFDSLLAASGWLMYASPVPFAHLAPVWILALWACFATTLNVSLRWLRDYPVAAVIFGAVGGPAAYIAGAALGGVEWQSMPAALGALAAGWAVFMPIMLRISARLDGWAEAPARAPALAEGH